MSGQSERPLNALHEEVSRHVLHPSNTVVINPDKRYCGDGRQLDVLQNQEGAIFVFGADGGILIADLALLHQRDNNVTGTKIRRRTQRVLEAYADLGLRFHIHTDDHTEDEDALKMGIYRFMNATVYGEKWTGCGHNNAAGHPDYAHQYGLKPETIRIAFELLGSEHYSDLLDVKVLSDNHAERVILASESTSHVVVPFNPETLQGFVVTPRATRQFVERLPLPGVDPSSLFSRIEDDQMTTAMKLAPGRQIYHLPNVYRPAFEPVLIPGQIIE